MAITSRRVCIKRLPVLSDGEAVFYGAENNNPGALRVGVVRLLRIWA